MIVPHVHACGHACGCAMPADPLCVHEALEAAAAADWPVIWSQRWPASRPHPSFADLPPAYGGPVPTQVVPVPPPPVSA